MGCAPSAQRLAGESERKWNGSDRLPALQKKPTVPKMVRADLEKAREYKTDGVMAPTKLPALDVNLAARKTRFDVTSPDLDNAPTKASAQSLPSVGPFTNKMWTTQASLSTSTQRQCGLSDNVSNRSSSPSDDEWNPREFGPLLESFCADATHRGADPYASFRTGLDKDEGDGFYLHFLQVNGGAAVAAQRAISAMELIRHASCDDPRTRFLMGGLNTPAGALADALSRSPTTSPGLGDERQAQQQRKSCYVAARELGPVDADKYMDALYQHSRERERTHFFIDPDGEIRRLYHTEGWHTLCSTKRRQELLHHRSSSSDSSGHHKGHRSRTASADTSSKSSHSPLHPATAAVGQPAAAAANNFAAVGNYSPSEQRGGSASQQRSSRFSNSDILKAITDLSYKVVPSPGKGSDGAQGYQQGKGSPEPQKPAAAPPSGSPRGPKRRDSQLRRDSPRRKATSLEMPLTESTASMSLGSGRASTLPGSRTGTDFFSQAFGGAAGDPTAHLEDPTFAGTTPPSRVLPHFSPILVRPEGDFPGGGSRRCSFNSLRREGDGAGGNSPEMTSPRRRQSSRRVSFSEGTHYFKKDPFYIAPRTEKESEYREFTPPEQHLRTPPAPPPLETVAVVASTSPTAAVASPRPDTSASYAQLTLLKEKMTQSRERNVASPV